MTLALGIAASEVAHLEPAVERLVALVEAVGHPIRLRVMAWAYDHPDDQFTPREMADRFGLPIENVAYHIRKLRECSMLREVRRTQVRGAVKHHLRLTAKGRRLMESLMELLDGE